MIGFRRVLAAGLLAVGLGVGGAAFTAGAAEAAACSTSSGVTVVINSSTLCAGFGGSALTVLKRVASTTMVQTDPGFLCRINGAPSDQSCVRDPPASAYWAFFTASRGGSWHYASVGVSGYTPPAGSVIGFSFGSGGKPGASVPPVLSTPKPKPSTSSSSRPAPTPSSSTRSTTRRPSTTPAGAASTASKAATSTTSTTASTTSTSDPTTLGSSPVSTTDGVVAGGPVEPTSASTSSGSAWPFVGGAAVVSALGGLAAYGARRRRLGQN